MQEIIGYCDGGCRGNGKDGAIGGWGVLLQFWVNGKIIAEKELNGGDYNTTNNKMELQACIELMKAIKDKTIPTTIYFDSKYCRDGLESWLDNWVKNGWKTEAKKPVKNVEQWKELYELKNKFANLKLEWCKGHADNEGNNRVDQLANNYMDILESEYCFKENENEIIGIEIDNKHNDILNFEDSNYKIFNDDCLEIMKNIPDNSIDLIVTDPPYKTTARGGSGNSGGMCKKKEFNNGKVFKYNNIRPLEFIPELYRILKEDSHCYIMTNHVNLQEMLNTATDSGFHFIKSLIWVKDNKIMGQCYMSQFEYILFLRKGKHKKINSCGTSDVLNIPNKKLKTELLDSEGNVVLKNGKHQMVNLHDTEKPIELMKILIENSSNEGDIVFEPFMGIGSTIIASNELNRKSIGVELDEKYFDIAKKRIENI